MDEAPLAPRLSLLVQSVNDAGDEVVLENLRTGSREYFGSLRALASAWIGEVMPAGDQRSDGESA